MPSRRLLLAFGLLLLVLVATSRPQRVGDAREYLAMAMNMARLQSPALSPGDMLRIEQQFEQLHFAGLPLAFHHQLTDASGRQDFFHFWFYPALAVPGIWLTAITGLHPNYGFVALNVLLFLGALWVVSTRLDWRLTAAVFCSPVLWWIDKSHTEVFTFSLLAVAFVLLREAPWWSMICLGAAATQNLPHAALVVCVGVGTLVVRRGAWRDSRFWTGACIATALALLHPVYYEWRWGLPTPQLVLGTQARVPTIQELGAVVWDPNIGVLFHAPLLVMTCVVAAVVVGVRARSRLIEMEIWLALAGAAIFLLSFAQTTNLNNGATPGMSRYALWLIPLAIPILQRAAVAVPPPSRRWFVLLALATCIWSIVAFQPRRPENYCAPSRIASILWTRWPSLDNPLPEIFAERLSGEEPGLVPVATPDCAKVLLIGGQWPVPCFPQPAPRICGTQNALCYANRQDGSYSFVRVAPPAGYSFERHRTWMWDTTSTQGVERILKGLRWRDLRRIRQSAPGAMVRATSAVSWTYGLQSDEELLVYVAEPRQGASLTLRLPGTMTGSLVDPETGDEIQPVRIESRPGDLVRLSLPARPGAIVLTLTRSR
jgi:hypothetical protein